MPESRDGGSTERDLSTECAVFHRLVPTFDRTMCGRFVLLNEEGVVGVFATEREAIDRGFDLLGAVPFLVRQVPSETVPPASLADDRPRRASP